MITINGSVPVDTMYGKKTKPPLWVEVLAFVIVPVMLVWVMVTSD